ncbi:MAG: hypothetical protein ACTS5F_00685 [Candidatus Hodgkinia cicadicola]
MLSALKAAEVSFIFSTRSSLENFRSSKGKILRKLCVASRRVYEVTCGVVRRLK